MYSQILVFFGILLVIINSNSYASVQVNHQSQHVTNDIPVDKMDQLPIPKDQTLIVRLPSNTLLKYTAYKDVSILHFRIPPDSRTAYFTFKALEESKSAFHRVCKPRDVTLHLKAGSYPVISPENITFPRNFLNADQRFKIYDLQFKSDGKQQRITVEGPQMGNWFAVAFLSWTDPNNDRIEQQDELIINIINKIFKKNPYLKNMDEEVSTLLREWGLETYITVFEDNAITSMSLPLLGATEIREMFPVIGHRVIFTRNFEAWRKLMHPNAASGSIIDSQQTGVGSSQNTSEISFALSDLLPEFQVSDTVQLVDPIEASVTTNKNLSNEDIDDLKKILECSLEGKGILTLDKNNPLDHKARLKLVRIICLYVLRENPERNITPEIYAKWANEIVHLFPAEKRSVYFHNKIVESSRGIITRLAGKLPDSVHNLKRKYRETGIITRRKRSLSMSPTSSRGESPKSLPIKRLATAFKIAENEELSDSNLEWLRNSSHPWETTEEKWEKTTNARFHRLKDMSIAQYFEEYPALKKVSGYKLLEKDFNTLYSENSQGLYENFPSIKNDIYSLARKKVNAKTGFISQLLPLEDSTEDVSNLGAFLLIPSLLTTSTIRLKGTSKKVWRPSKSEARDGFITIVHSDAEIEESIALRRDKLQQYGLTLQPYILLVGLAASCETLLLAEMSVSRFIPIILNSGQVHNGTLTSTDQNNATSSGLSSASVAAAAALANATFTNQADLNRPNTTTASSSTPSNEPQQPTSSSSPPTTRSTATMTTTTTSSSAFTSSPSSSSTTMNATIATNSEIIYKFYVPENVGVATARITIGNGCLTCPDVGFYIQANALPTDTNYIQSTIIKPNQTGEITIEFYVHSSAWHFIRLRFEQFQEPSAASMSATSAETAGSFVSEGTLSTASVYTGPAAASSVSRSSRASPSMHLEGFTNNQRIQHLYAVDEYQRWVNSASGVASTINPATADDDVSNHTTPNTTWYEMEYALQIDFHNLQMEEDENTEGEADSVPWKPIIYRDMEFYPLLRQTYREFFMFDYDLIPDSNGTVPLVLNLTAGTPAGFSFEVGDVYDIGGTLSFAVSMKHGLKGLDLKGTPLPSTERSGILAEKLIGRPPAGKDSDDKEEDDQALPRSNQTIIVCMRMGEPGEPTWPDKCRYGRKVLPASSIVNNTDSNTSTGLIHVPFPESGQWYVTMGLYCHGAETAARVTIIDSVKEFVKKYVGMLESMRPPCACANAAKFYQTCINDRKCLAQMNETETLKIKECMMDSKCSDDFVDMTKKFESHHKFATEQHFALDNCNTSVVFTISSSPCVAGRCGRFGRCYHYMSGGFVFSTCVCMKGYRGWDCTEDAQVPSSISILVASLLLTLSNLLFIPSIYMGVRRKYYTESVIYFFAMFFSTFYHACDSGEDEYSFCLVKIGVLQFCDFYCGLLAIWVTLVAMAHIRPQFVSLLHMLGAILLAFGTELNKQSLWVFLAPALTGICIISASWGLRCQKSRKLFPAKKYLSVYMPLGAVLVMVGLVCYAFLQTKQNYHIVHSIWHIVMALSILCLLPSRKSFIPKC